MSFSPSVRRLRRWRRPMEPKPAIKNFIYSSCRKAFFSHVTIYQSNDPLPSPAACTAVGEGAFIIDEFPPLFAVQRRIAQVAVDGLTQMRFVIRHPPSASPAETLVGRPLANFPQRKRELAGCVPSTWLVEA